jgi:hypothetical protein
MPSLPGTGKSFNQFLFDEADCKHYASAQIGVRATNEPGTGNGNETAASSGVSAPVRAESELLVGSMVEGDMGASGGLNLQQRYDLAYYQCMYAKGHRIPVSGDLEYSRQLIKDKDSNHAPLPAPSRTISLPSDGSFVPPPPPHGHPPPPPPDVYTPQTTSDDTPQTSADDTPHAIPDDTPQMPSDDVQPPMPPNGNPPSPSPDS